MIKMDKRGQISLEFVLIVAFMLVLVLLVGSYVGDQNEANMVSAAARSGAIDAASSALLLNRSMEPVRVTGMQLSGSGQNITILIDISGSISSNTNQTIASKTLQSIAAQGFTLNTTNASNQFVVTSRHIYKVLII